MTSPEKFLIAMILVGYAAAEVMLVQQGASVLDMAAVLVVAGALVLYVAIRSRRGATGVPAQDGSACASCSTSACNSCRSAPAASGRR